MCNTDCNTSCIHYIIHLLSLLSTVLLHKIRSFDPLPKVGSDSHTIDVCINMCIYSYDACYILQRLLSMLFIYRLIKYCIVLYLME
jgi:hypothetical protein